MAAASRLCWQTEQPMVMPCEVALEAAHRLYATLAFGFLASEVGTGLGVDPATCDRNDVQCTVELPVATAMQAVAVASPGGCWYRSDARHPCEVCVAGEALRAGGLPDQDRRAERPAAS